MQPGTQLLVEEGRQCWSEDEGHQGETGRLGRVATVLVADAVIDLDLERSYLRMVSYGKHCKNIDYFAC